MATVLDLFVNSGNPRSFANRLRRKRASHFKQLVDESLEQKGQCRVLDLGGTQRYWEMLNWPLDRSLQLHFYIVNLPDQGVVNSERFTHIAADATRELPFATNSFDVCHSNSVIEHVGDWRQKRAFAANVSRAAPCYFVQTPNYWFPIEPHFVCPFFHWLPKPVQIHLVQNVALGWYPKLKDVDQAMDAVESKDLLTRSLLHALFPDAEILTEKVAFLAKSLIAIRGA